MSSSIGNILKVTIFGESHGKAVGLTVDGLPAGIKIPYEQISQDLLNRKTHDSLSTERDEKDEIIFLSGVFEDATNGAPLTFILENKDVHSESYKKGDIRPSHSDLVNYEKFNGKNDYRGGGFSSGRLTAPIIVLGAICKEIAAKHGIKVISHIKSIHGIEDISFENIENIKSLENNAFPVIDNDAEKMMKNEIEKARKNNDSVGGSIETIILNAPVGLGEPYFDSFESYISQLVFSIGGVKGISFGNEQKFLNGYGSEANDQMRYENGEIRYLSNNNGGINGGLTNGQPVVFKTIIKPTSSIGLKQQSINIIDKTNIDLEIKGRHDPCIVHRVRPVIDALTYFAIIDLLMEKESKNI